MRTLVQTAILASLVLAIGLAQQYTQGAGVFAPDGVLTSAQEQITQFVSEFKTAQVEATQPQSPAVETPAAPAARRIEARRPMLVPYADQFGACYHGRSCGY